MVDMQLERTASSSLQCAIKYESGLPGKLFFTSGYLSAIISQLRH